MIRRVVVTRPSGPYSGGPKLAAKLIAQGFEALELPLLRCVSMPLSDQGERMVLELLASASKAWLAFLSPTAVSVWRDLVADKPDLKAATSKAMIAVQGSGTAEALGECLGRRPDFTPTVFVAEEFAREFSRILSKEQPVVVPQSADGRDLFAPMLVSLGFQARSIDIYKLEREKLSEQSLKTYRCFVDQETAIVFMSPSAVRAAVANFGLALGTDKIVSVGPITTQALKKEGYPVWREASEHSEDGVVRILYVW